MNSAPQLTMVLFQAIGHRNWRSNPWLELPYQLCFNFESRILSRTARNWGQRSMTSDGKDSSDAAITKPAEEDSLRTSPSMLQAAISGDHQAWSEIVEIYSDRIFAKCRKSGLSEIDSAEVVHEVFVSLWNNREKFQIRSQPGSFRAWLATVTFREVCNLHRDRLKPGRNAVGGECGC